MTRSRSAPAVTGWVGWIWFAAAVLVTNGVFNVIDGLVALFKDEVYVQTSKALVVFDFTAWGWILLLIGAIQVLVGIALASGRLWARMTAILVAMFSAVAQIAYITVFPLWSLTVIVLDVVVLWALIVHGEEAETVARS